ncbi:hypothetical protein AcV7_002430 [Taiwanofungus camphoratus]|nr:hypothetical protein AcV7_002430 [Antrodia cinnamomea]
MLACCSPSAAGCTPFHARPPHRIFRPQGTSPRQPVFYRPARASPGSASRPDPPRSSQPPVQPYPEQPCPVRTHARTHSLSPPARLGRHASRIRGFCHSVQCLPLPSLPLWSARLNSITHQRPAGPLAGVPDGRSNTVISVRRGRVVLARLPSLFSPIGQADTRSSPTVPSRIPPRLRPQGIVAAPCQIGPLRCNRPAGVPDTGVPSHIAHRTSHIAHRTSRIAHEQRRDGIAGPGARAARVHAACPSCPPRPPIRPPRSSTHVLY